MSLPTTLSLLALISFALGGGTPIPITFYTDNGCTTPSTFTANTTLELNICAITPGLGSYILDPFPCASGDVVSYVFSDTACGNVLEFDVFSGGGNDGDNADCYGPTSGDLAAIMLSCNQETPGTPAGSTTVEVGIVATGAAQTGSASPTGSSGGGGGGGGDGGDGSTSGTDNNTDTNATSDSGWNSLDLGTKIGIIVALAVGIPPIILTIYMIQQKRKKQRMQAEGHGTPMQAWPHAQAGGSGYFHNPYAGGMGAAHTPVSPPRPEKVAGVHWMAAGINSRP